MATLVFPRPWFFCIGSLFAGTAFAGGPIGVGYAQATGYYKQDTRPTLYQPLNLLDARDATAWCSPTADPLNDSLSFGLSEAATISELKVSNGNNFDGNTFALFGRARRLSIRSGRQVQSVNLEDTRGPQALALNPPLRGARFTIEILDQYPGEDADQPVCLTDIVVVAEGRALNGAWLTQKLKYDKWEAMLMGTWFAGHIQTPDRFLAFNFDGTFRYSFEPFDTTRDKEVVITGGYDASSGRVVFDIGGKKRDARFVRAPGKKGLSLTFEGDLPAELKQAFRSEP